MTIDNLRAMLTGSQDFSLPYDQLSYEPCEDLHRLNEIIETAKAAGYGVTNSVSDRRMYFWRREAAKGRK